MLASYAIYLSFTLLLVYANDLLTVLQQLLKPNEVSVLILWNENDFRKLFAKKREPGDLSSFFHSCIFLDGVDSIWTSSEHS